MPPDSHPADEGFFFSGRFSAEESGSGPRSEHERENSYSHDLGIYDLKKRSTTIASPEISRSGSERRPFKVQELGIYDLKKKSTTSRERTQAV